MLYRVVATRDWWTGNVKREGGLRRKSCDYQGKWRTLAQAEADAERMTRWNDVSITAEDGTSWLVRR